MIEISMIFIKIFVLCEDFLYPSVFCTEDSVGSDAQSSAGKNPLSKGALLNATVGAATVGQVLQVKRTKVDLFPKPPTNHPPFPSIIPIYAVLLKNIHLYVF